MANKGMKASFFQRLGGIFDKNKVFNGVDYDSSAIKSVKFHPNKNEADVVYTGLGNKTYKFPMTQEEFDAFQDAGSKGGWMYYNARRYSNYNGK